MSTSLVAFNKVKLDHGGPAPGNRYVYSLSK